MKLRIIFAVSSLAISFSAPAFGSLLRCETGSDAGFKASGTFYVTDRCDTGYALKNPKTGKLNCLLVEKDFNRFDRMNVDVCVVESGDGLVIVDMRPQGAE